MDRHAILPERERALERGNLHRIIPRRQTVRVEPDGLHDMEKLRRGLPGFGVVVADFEAEVGDDVGRVRAHRQAVVGRRIDEAHARRLVTQGTAGFAPCVALHAVVPEAHA